MIREQLAAESRPVGLGLVGRMHQNNKGHSRQRDGGSGAHSYVNRLLGLLLALVASDDNGWTKVHNQVLAMVAKVWGAKLLHRHTHFVGNEVKVDVVANIILTLSGWFRLSLQSGRWLNSLKSDWCTDKNSTLLRVCMLKSMNGAD